MTELIPAIDLMNGNAVRLQKGDFSKNITYSEDPVKLARDFQSAGISRLHVVDLDGAKTGKPEHLETLRQITSDSGLEIDFGGGVRDITDVRDALSTGIKYITVGSAAVSEASIFSMWLEQFGAERFILAADVKEGHVAFRGWQSQSGMKPEPFIGGYAEQDIKQVLCTDVSRDGMLEGPNIELYTNLKAAFPELQIIASGGIRNMDDIHNLNQAGVDAVIIGRAFYEGNITLADMQHWNGK